MKIIHINATCGRGSTGLMAVEISELQRRNGHETYIAYGTGKSNYPGAYCIGNDWDHKLHSLINTRLYGEEGTGSILATRQLLKWIDSIQPDIIHLHNIHNHFLNFHLFFRYIITKSIPIVWMFPDCWAFTGKCYHFTEAGCMRWKTECHDCPQLRKSGPMTWFFDKSRKIYHLKQQLFQSLRYLDIVTISKWLQGVTEQSIANIHPIHMIYCWIDREKFHERKDDSIYERYGLDRNKKILISVSAQWIDSKTRLTDAIRLAKLLPDDYLLILVGQMLSKQKLPHNIIHLGYVNGTEEMSKLYSAALAYVNFSVEDTFSNVTCETHACGTPFIVFNSTALPEVAAIKEFIVPPHDIEAMLEKVKEIARNGREYYSRRCVEHVTKNFDYETNVNRYLELYEQALKRKNEGEKTRK